jgi:hypothetical protein
VDVFAKDPVGALFVLCLFGGGAIWGIVMVLADAWRRVRWPS